MSLSLVDVILDNLKRLDETDFPPEEDCKCAFCNKSYNIQGTFMTLKTSEDFLKNNG